MPTGGGLDKALRRGAEIGCTAVQVFTSSPQQWRGREVTGEMANAFRKAMAETGVTAVVSHDSYLVNLSAPDPELREKSANALAAEMQRCSAYGIGLVVSHIGAHNGQGEEVGLSLAAEGIRRVLHETPEGVCLLMETTAGQGTSLNWRFEHLAILLERTSAPHRLGVCLDTCHVFAAGYDIRTAEGYDLVVSGFDRLVGLERLKAIHVNDSKKPLGSRVDRHAHVGDGEIGIEAFRLLVNDSRFVETPMVIETPDADSMHAENVRRLRSLMSD